MCKSNTIKSLIPRRIRIILRNLLGITALHERIDQLHECIDQLHERIDQLHERIDQLHERIDQLEELILESKEEVCERSKIRWYQTEPDSSLTWGERKVTGNNFILKVFSYNVFGYEKIILEIGPGYGRLLNSCLEQKVPFKKYVAVDISIKNVEYLREKFKGENLIFIHGDAEKISFDGRFDVILSSLVFKHLFPSFEKVLRNVANYVNPGGMFFFDLIEEKKRYFENDAVTYIRYFTRAEILEILGKVSLELIAFDQVQHNPEHSRLLVVARKPK